MADPYSLGPHRLPRGATHEERVARNRERLFRALSLGTTVAFVGAGCSAPLGYPRWSDIAGALIRETLRALRRHPSEPKNKSALASLDSYEGRLADGEELRPVELMFILGVCQSAARQLAARDPSANDFVGDYFRRAFQPRPEPAAPAVNPYHALLELPIKRFVTTNYDEEIERALEHVRGIPRADFGIDPSSAGRASDAPPPKSFTQTEESYEQLVLFALAKIEEMKNTVFHCHGRYDKSESIVASEEDYQKWYLLDREGAPAFRQTIELLLTSNPILFVGYGLQDEDLLQPLRLLAALDARQREASSLFALMSEKPGGGSEAEEEYLRVRYGVQVVPYEGPSSSSAEARGRALAEELRQLKRASLEWRESWLEKPFIRKVRVDARPPKPYQHYSLRHAGEMILGRAGVEKQLDHIESEIASGARVVAVVGRGGTGKSWHAMRLVERLTSRPGSFAGFFFWSSYYADDALTGFDRLLEYLEDSGGRTPGDRLERIRHCLESGRYLIVLDGIERLLRETGRPEIGSPVSAQVKALLELIASERSRSAVVLTSRLLPELYESKPGGEHVKIFSLKRMQTRDICQVAPFRHFAAREVGALCSLLEGHTYALVLAAGYLGQRRPPREAGEAMRDLQHRLAKTPPDRRVTRMIREAVEALDDGEGPLAREFLRHLAVFMSPVTTPAARHCYRAAVEAQHRNRGSNSRPAELEDLIDRLVSRHLLFRVENEVAEKAWTVHPTVRSFIFEPELVAPNDPLPNFTLAGFTSGTAVLHPGSRESCDRIKDLFDRLVRASEEAFAARRQPESVALCRSAFSVVRSRMEAITASRWCHYDEYARFGYHLIDLARKISSPGRWRHIDPPHLSLVEHPEAPLYADELAWLYNDLGLILCAEGNVADMYGLWEQGLEISRAIEMGEEPGQHVVQSLLHQNYTFIEVGRLDIARVYLDDTKKANSYLGDEDLAARIVGYRGQIEHLQGDLHKAEENYRDAIDRFEQMGRNPRAESIFCRHLGDLMIEKEDCDQARERIRKCRALADAAGYRDLVAYARLSKGRLHRKAEALKDALREYQAVQQLAEKIGIRRLEATAFCELARLALDLGDAENARQQALSALLLANELGLGLRKTDGLVALGLATVKTGKTNLGKEYLWQALRLAEDQRYWLRAHEVERELEKLGEPPQWTPASRRGMM